jgi:hypothetical protein
VALLLGGVVWYAASQSSRIVVGILLRAQRWRVIFVSVDPPVLALFSLFFKDLVVLSASTVVLNMYHIIAMII